MGDKDFTFAGFTATSLDKDVALKFAYKASLKGDIPVIFEIDLKTDY